MTKDGRELTPEEEYNELCIEYLLRFKQGFGYTMFEEASKPVEEKLAEIRECLRTGKPKQYERYVPDGKII